MTNIELVKPDESAKWDAVLNRCIDRDSYHHLYYHHLSAQQDGGDPHLFVYCENDRLAALPFLLRSIPNEPDWCDATSVYGYPGLLASFQEPDKDFAARFQRALATMLNDRKVVTLFSRIHPLINTLWLLDPAAIVTDHGMTVWIDLSESDEQNLADANQMHRRLLRKAHNSGMTFRFDESLQKLNEFRTMYEETMRRNQAAAYYFFSEQYFEKLRGFDALKLFVAELDGRTVGATLALASGKYLNYHLNGIPTEHLSLGCPRFLLDGIRKWGKANGYAWFNLGGGVGSRDDSLLKFKSGFSKLRFPFRTIRMVLNSDVYATLARKHPRLDRAPDNADANFFPAYRS